MLDQIRPERYLYEEEAQHVSYKRGTIDMARFIAELKQHQEGEKKHQYHHVTTNKLKLTNSLTNLYLIDYTDIDRLQSITFKIWKENTIISIMTYSQRDLDEKDLTNRDLSDIDLSDHITDDESVNF